jgi:WD40 repeat protein
MMREWIVAFLVILLSLPPILSAEQKSSPVWTYKAGDGINSVSISGDGKLAIAGGFERYVWVFRNDAAEPAWRSRIGEEYSYINSLAISSDGSYFAVGCNDGRVALYRWKEGTADLVWTYSGAGKVSPYPRAVAISGDGSWVAVGMASGEVALFSKDNNTPVWMEKCGRQVISVSISRNGRYVVAATDNGAFVFGSTGRIFSSHTGFTTATAISDDGSVIAVGNKEGKLRILDPSGQTRREDLSLEKCIWSLDMSSDGRYLVAAIGEQTGKILKCTLEGEPSVLAETNLPASAVSISSDGLRVFAADAQNVYFFENDQRVWTSNVVKGWDGNIECVDLSDAGQYMVACTARSDTEHKVYFFQATPLPPKEEGGVGRINMILVAVGLVVAILAIILILRRRISQEMVT